MSSQSEYPMRINKYLAHEGHATRRGADKIIEEGKVLVNGDVAVLGQKVNEDDKVEVRFRHKKYTYLAYYKPRGVITHSPAEGEVDIAMRIKKDYSLTDVFPIGRVDKDSEGLILLTDDGRITERVLNPDANHEKEYLVVVDKRLTNSFKKKMELGVDIEGYLTKPAEVELVTDIVFKIIITEGKKHQIRRMCASLGYQIEKLKRIRVMNIKIEQLKPAQYRKIAGGEMKELLDELKLK